TEKAAGARAKDGDIPQAARERLGLGLNSYRSEYLAAVRASSDVPLAKTHAEFDQDNWYRVAAGKGVCLLHTLRPLFGEKAFEEMMDEFGRTHAGKEVAAEEFQKQVELCAGKSGVKLPAQAFFDQWLKQPGLPKLELGKATVVAAEKGCKVEGVIRTSSQCL